MSCDPDLCTVGESTKCGGYAITKNCPIDRTDEDGRNTDAPGGINVFSTTVEVECTGLAINSATLKPRIIETID